MTDTHSTNGASAEGPTILYFSSKRLIDVVAASLGLAVLGPGMLGIAGIVRLTSKGPALYRGKRVGKDGQPFYMLKYRSMVVDAESLGGPSTSADDPRITGIGGLLRKLKLDELPQLINVLRGEMSLVGPRPEVPSEVELYDEEQRLILTVRPGITGKASLEFSNEGEILRGAEDPHAAYKELIQPEKLRLELEYLRERSLITDLSLVAKTVRRVVFRGV